MTHVLRSALVALLAFFALAAPASASSLSLVGLSSSIPGTLYNVSPGTGAATAIVDLVNTDSTSLVGLAFLDGTLYASDVYNGGYSFGSINTTTGAFTFISDQDGSSNWHALTNNDAAHVLYTVDLSNGTSLKTVTPVGVTTTIGLVGVNVAGLAYDNASGILYGADALGLYTINTTTAAASLVGFFAGLPSNRLDLALDPLSGTLYLNGATDLYTVNKTTGALTLVGSNGPVQGFGIDGLAVRVLDDANPAVPEPGSMILLGTGVLALARRRFGVRK